MFEAPDNKLSEDDKKNEFVRQICDKSTYEAIDMLSIVNKGKADLVKNHILKQFEQTRAIITFEQYKKLIAGLNTESSISFKRKTNLYELEDIDDL